MRRSLSRTARALIMIAVMATGILLGYTTASQLGWVHWQWIPFQPLVREFILRPGATFAPGGPELYVITSSADVERIAADVLNLSQGQEDQRLPFVAALRTVDFSRHLGVFALSNQRSGCAQFTVRRVSQIQRTLVLHADIRESGWACPAVITDPALVIVIDKQVIQSPITTVVLRNGWVDVAHATVAPRGSASQPQFVCHGNLNDVLPSCPEEHRAHRERYLRMPWRAPPIARQWFSAIHILFVRLWHNPLNSEACRLCLFFCDIQRMEDMVNPFKPATPWTKERHRQWAEDRTKGKITYTWYGIRVGFHHPWVRAVFILFAGFSVFLLGSTLSRGLSTEVISSLLSTGQMLLIMFGFLSGVFIIAHAGTALERWDTHEALFHAHENPETVLVTVTGGSGSPWFALTNTSDFADTWRCQILSFANGTWTVLHTTTGGPKGIDMVLLPDQRLAVTRTDQSLLFIEPDRVTYCATPGIAGYALPLTTRHLLIAGVAKESTSSARIDLETGAIEPLDLLVQQRPALFQGQAYLCDHGRYQIAIVSEDTLQSIPHNHHWYPEVLTVGPANQLYTAIFLDAQKETELWVYNDGWRQLPNPPSTYVFDLACDGETLLALTEHTIYRYNADDERWIAELPADQHASIWQLRTLDQGVIAFNPLSRTIAHRVHGVWEAVTVVPSAKPTAPVTGYGTWFPPRAESPPQQ